MNVKVTKLTDIDLLHKANSYTTGKPSKMSLKDCYKSLHSPCRTQLFFIEMEDIPLFCASQFVRSKVGVEWWQRSKRTDRGGENFRTECKNLGVDLKLSRDRILYHVERGEELDEGAKNLLYGLEEISDNLCFGFPYRFDRYAPTSLAGLFNAESIINMSNKRLCNKASKETREIWIKVLAKLVEVDLDLYLFCQRPCVACGLCREPKPCGYLKTENYKKERVNYLKLFEDGE